MSTAPVTSITEELLAELEDKADFAASNEQHLRVVIEAPTARALIAHIRSLEARLEKAEKDGALERAIQRAACDLPKGWEISVRVEKDGGGVDLIDPYGTVADFPTNCERLADEVSDAIDAAISQEASHE